MGFIGGIPRGLSSLGGTGFEPCFPAGLAGVGFGAADHPGMVTLDGRGGTFPGPGFTGSFEVGILELLVIAKVHREDPAEVTGAVSV